MTDWAAEMDWMGVKEKTGRMADCQVEGRAT